ncbi:MAG TPA: hypothetical protein VGV60_13000 [Candidatus Polarisedimenticolia bacterium]|jgi:hypothetical protein|nr:hypothetical protein [Candidatus Polarisedimenticolia bacterium]
MRSAAALRASHHSLYPPADRPRDDHPPIDLARADLPRADLARIQPAKIAAPRRFVCREDAPAYHVQSGNDPAADTPAADTPAADTPAASASSAYPVERSLRQADALALSLRAGLDRIAIPLARAAAAFVQRQAWSDFGFARVEDHARERFGRSGRWVKDCA